MMYNKLCFLDWTTSCDDSSPKIGPLGRLAFPWPLEDFLTTHWQSHAALQTVQVGWLPA